MAWITLETLESLITGRAGSRLGKREENHPSTQAKQLHTRDLTTSFRERGWPTQKPKKTRQQHRYSLPSSLGFNVTLSKFPPGETFCDTLALSTHPKLVASDNIQVAFDKEEESFKPSPLELHTYRAPDSTSQTTNSLEVAKPRRNKHNILSSSTTTTHSGMDDEAGTQHLNDGIHLVGWPELCLHSMAHFQGADGFLPPS